MFSTLEASAAARKRRAGALVCGALAEVLAIVVAIFLGVWFPQGLPITKHYLLVWLPASTSPDPPEAQPARKMSGVVIPKLKSPENPELVDPPVADLKVPKIPPPLTSQPLPVPLPPPPVVQPSPPPEWKESVVARTGIFGGAEEEVTRKRPVEQVQTGGFGTLPILTAKVQGESPGHVPKLGSFARSDDSGGGNAAAGGHTVQGVVVSAGFGSVVADKGSGSRTGATDESKVAVGGFEKARQIAAAPAENPHKPTPTVFQPVEILFKPSPVYTEEARRLKIQGEVVLSVVFQANGAISVTGVVRPLGHGLDKAAEQAATQIRFKPAMRDGKATDFPATLRIQFRLADQSS